MRVLIYEIFLRKKKNKIRTISFIFQNIEKNLKRKKN